MAKVLVSFKEKEKDLYDIVAEQGDKSNFMKDALKFYIKHKESKNVSTLADMSVKSTEIEDILSGI